MTTPEPVADRVAPRWQDPTVPTPERVALLLEQMTLEEKVAQLGSRWIRGGLPDAEADSGQVPVAAVAAPAASAAGMALARGWWEPPVVNRAPTPRPPGAPAEAAEAEYVIHEEPAAAPEEPADQPAAEPRKTCPQCGAPVSEDALFCNKCGAQL